MTILHCLQVFGRTRCAIYALVVAFLVLPLSAYSGENKDGEPFTPRQLEILAEMERVSPHSKSGDEPWMLEVWDSDAGLEGIAPLPDGGGNAAACFKRLETLYPSEKNELARSGGGTETEGVRALLEAAAMADCRLAPDYYPEFVTAESAQPDFLVLREYLGALLRRGEAMEKRGDAAEAERCYRSAIVCGRHLTNDRTSSLVFITGLIFKLRGTQAYTGFLFRNGRHDDARAAAGYIEHVGILMRAVDWKANVALGEFADFACLAATMRIATDDKEAFWRKDAVVRLGALRYGIPESDGRTIRRNTRFEQMADETLMEVAAGDPDPSVRELAIWTAKNLTPGKYRQLEHLFK